MPCQRKDYGGLAWTNFFIWKDWEDGNIDGSHRTTCSMFISYPSPSRDRAIQSNVHYFWWLSMVLGVLLVLFVFWCFLPVNLWTSPLVLLLFLCHMMIALVNKPSQGETTWILRNIKFPFDEWIEPRFTKKNILSSFNFFNRKLSNTPIKLTSSPHEL